ncbi:tRNA (N6-isopentenyl adenosine(37)-C2)-methylthiotransferase MiaB [methanotrophic endosymbiont of Bathymodiolus puteoserpentis (Logatchev)]|jgi:tRNA-2-methylthio-N6-dimethylallyladenosine synthase|uniref:tRNA (N6-isopentenyl adenosine(37)-C2)-methylthiotransferase MiaB n=1 Tax=methanotrophic endosymbiont of Bathymodiolus puteoserpentis (Logatchev) TaxID=343235 RepID=UPI0013C8906C|nr:tRNA (N6-isopentenyl adenosine(37)-C2)-methylthiotransferase MiaB [methanotrophic endosymbiont of Bathymodiolus puteoserpentis (Logatchev)]SHE19886.1 tRNA-i(6)A37 methylthiotransferase [methanotrophic endosymbiont of Bathymodiolus puteoserpentis (Logatchev)]
MAQKLFVLTTGCQMNEYDSDKMADVLKASHGIELTETPEEADVLLLNTCSIREKAQEKVFSLLGRWRKIKDQRPDVIIGVGGCVASQEGVAIQKRAPFVDIVFGPQTLHRLPELLNKARSGEKHVVDISFPEIEKFDALPEPRAEGPKAFVSVMEGCSKYCTFCVVPYTRGEEISRPVQSVLEEITTLAEQGVREVNLLGQNVNAYRGEMNEGEIADFALLLHFVAAVDGIDRIRFTTSHPIEFTDELVDAFEAIPELVNHLHLPVQSGSDNILAMMKRGHTRADYLATMEKVKAVRPDISLSSDFIIGFPGETDQDFADTLDLIEQVGFDFSYSFIYSARPGTPAAEFPDDTSDDTKKERLSLLQKRLDEMTKAISNGMVDTVQTVLVEGLSKKNQLQVTGRTENNRVVNFIGHPRLVGQFVDVLITEALPNSLRGRAVESSLDKIIHKV